MAVRALIIAIESYPDAEGMARSLPGSLQAGLNFRDWLLRKLTQEGRAADAQIIFCSEPPLPGALGAERRDVLESIVQLKTDGRGTTEELFVFFSGHGFAFVEKPGSRADVIITSDYRNVISGDCCLNLDQIVAWLRDHLGPGSHYFFIDACRNKLNGNQVQIGSFLTPDTNSMAEASSFVLQSTIEGAVAAVGDAFPRTLLEGLEGRGRAKVWDPTVTDAMFVRYDSLRRFLKEKLAARQPITSKVSGELGESDAVFAKIEPVPNVECTIEIEGRLPTDQVSVVVQRGRAAPEPPFALAGQSLSLQPDSYVVSLAIEDATVDPSTKKVELYESQTLKFRRLPAGVRFLGELESFDQRPADTWSPLDESLGMRGVELGLDNPEATRVDLETGIFLQSIPRQSIANQLPERNGGLDFSEALPGIADTDLNVWLTILGGSRILDPRGSYSKLAAFPLHNFSDEPESASPVYVLAGLEDPGAVLQVSVADDPACRWVEATQPVGMPGIREVYAATRPGSKLISFRLGDEPTLTVASYARPGNGTLLTLTQDAAGEFCVSQYSLPLGHLASGFSQAHRERLQERNQLEDLWMLASACRTFRKHGNVNKELAKILATDERLDIRLSSNWCNPLGAALAGYEMLRRGDAPGLSQVVDQMIRYFPDFPDTCALAILNGRVIDRPDRPPLVFDGLRAFSSHENWLPLPASHLDFNSPWTAWRAAVS